MACNRLCTATITNIKTGEQEKSILVYWADSKGFSRSAVYSAMKRGGIYKGYRFEKAEVASIDTFNRRISPQQKKMIIDAYRGGASINECRYKFNLSAELITRVLKEAGVEIRKRGVPSQHLNKPKILYKDHEIDDEGKFRALVTAGWHPANIADEFTTSVEKVYTKMKELNLKGTGNA